MHDLPAADHRLCLMKACFPSNTSGRGFHGNGMLATRGARRSEKKYYRLKRNGDSVFMRNFDKWQ
jgi:hypothetical protein